jgi:hypothetical protein
MRTTARLLTSAVLAAAATGLGAGACGAYPGDGDPLEVFPSTAEPGSTVTVNTTACGRNGQATGGKCATGEVIVRGQQDGERDNGRDDEGDGRRREEPSGPVRTGLGGSVGPDTTQIAAGVTVLAAAAVGGTLLLRRRARGAQGS